MPGKRPAVALQRGRVPYTDAGHPGPRPSPGRPHRPWRHYHSLCARPRTGLGADAAEQAGAGPHPQQHWGPQWQEEWKCPWAGTSGVREGLGLGGQAQSPPSPIQNLTLAEGGARPACGEERGLKPLLQVEPSAHPTQSRPTEASSPSSRALLHAVPEVASGAEDQPGGVREASWRGGREAGPSSVAGWDKEPWRGLLRAGTP